MKPYIVTWTNLLNCLDHICQWELWVIGKDPLWLLLRQTLEIFHIIRCLAHVDRQARRLLPKHSPYQATQALRNVASMLMLAEIPTDSHVWQTSLARWEKQYGSMLKEKTHAPMGTSRSWWYTHGNVRRAWRLLTHDPDPLFVFLTNRLVPKTNNALEGVNSNLKQKLGDHRGMSFKRQSSFLSWYMAFTRVKTDEDLKKLWGYWKSDFSRN